jgi:hypothetical protein
MYTKILWLIEICQYLNTCLYQYEIYYSSRPNFVELRVASLVQKMTEYLWYHPQPRQSRETFHLHFAEINMHGRISWLRREMFTRHLKKGEPTKTCIRIIRSCAVGGFTNGLEKPAENRQPSFKSKVNSNLWRKSNYCFLAGFFKPSMNSLIARHT